MKVYTMKNLLIILSLTSLIIISCSKNNDTTKPIDNSNKTIKELITQNEWIFKQGSVLRTTDIDKYDTVVRFNLDSTIKVSEYKNDTFIRDFGFIHTNYLLRGDSVYGYLVYYRDRWYNVDSLIYKLKRDSNNDLVGTKERWFWNNSQYNSFGPVNVRIGIR